MTIVTVVYAYDKNKLGIPWIYGVYKDSEIAFQIQEKMQNNKKYKHLIWSNNIIKLK